MGTIQIKTSFHFFQFMMLLWRPRITIDGVRGEKSSWGTTTHEVTAGEHEVGVRVHGLIGPGIAGGSTKVSVAEGQTVSLVYKPRLIFWFGGKIQPAAA